MDTFIDIDDTEVMRLQKMTPRSIDPEMFRKTLHEAKQQQQVKQERIHWDISRSLCCKSIYHGNTSNLEATNFVHILKHRELSGNIRRGQSLLFQKVFMPLGSEKEVRNIELPRERRHRLYCGEFNSSGTKYLIAGQSNTIYVCDTTSWMATILPAQQVRWAITDAHFLEDTVCYSTITSTVRMVRENPHTKEIHEHACRLSTQYEFGVWSFCMNLNRKQLIAGTSSDCLVLHDIESGHNDTINPNHSDDINAVTYFDQNDGCNIVLSGSDDELIQMYDVRTDMAQPIGRFLGHTEGITYLESRQDGYYFISNSKDQTIKLWDIRKRSNATKEPENFLRVAWDYRGEEYPFLYKPRVHPNDESVMTYRGHSVLQTLIRSHFSPLHTTAREYIICGSSDGNVYIYSVLSGQVVQILTPPTHTRFRSRYCPCIRDVSWHPFDLMISSIDFEGHVYLWQRKS